MATSAAFNPCNLYSIGLSAAYQCGINWWQAEDLGKVVSVKYKLSDIVKESLRAMLNETTYASIDASLIGNIMADSTDPLAKIVESAVTVEPYLTFAIADMLEGYDITEAELQKFNLPADLATKSNLVKMFTDYFDFSCTE